MKEKTNLKDFEQHAVEELREGKPLTGIDEVFIPLIKRVIEAALESKFFYHRFVFLL